MNRLKTAIGRIIQAIGGEIMKDTETTKVIFRKFSNGDVIAIFPEELGTKSPYTFGSYMHFGQHGSCSDDLTSVTKPASKAEYSDLKAELESIGYNLQLIKRNRYAFLQVRRDKLKAMELNK